MTAAALIPTLLPMFMVIAMRRAEARIHRQLTDAQATDAETAIELTLHRSMDKRRLRGLVEGGAVRLAADSRHYLDATGWQDYQRRRRHRVILAMTIVLALVGSTLAVVFAMQ
ncbi:MAG: hypothetical protein JNK15_20420 [Planctomycetes bacterium]|nr:hypothetical protein [Planctomycetota bacterium]